MEYLILFVFIALNGAFSMSEIAIVSARKARLQQSAQAGSSGACAALELANRPDHFLSTVQVGITAIAILSGAFGESVIADRLVLVFERYPAFAEHSRLAATAITVALITYFSVVLGELVPKRLALHRPEAIAARVARPMQVLARLAHPLVAFLSLSASAVLALLGARKLDEPPVTEEEIKVMIGQGTQAGVFEASEQKLLSNVFRLDDQRVTALMTPRCDIFYLDVEDPFELNRGKIIASKHNTLVVCRGGVGNVLGLVIAKDLLAQLLEGRQPDLLAATQPALFVPEVASAIQLLETFKKHRTYLAFVVDEYGDVKGLVTLSDVLGALVGDLPWIAEPHAPQAVQRKDGSWLLDGQLSVERFKEIFELQALPEEIGGDYHTVAGLVLIILGRVPTEADRCEWDGLRFEVVDMDRNRIDKVLVSRSAE